MPLNNFVVSVPDNCPEGQFIYFLMDGVQVVYIGQTQSLRRRISQHRTSGKSFDRVEAVACEREDAIRIERELIEEYKPKYNSLWLVTTDYTSKTAMLREVTEALERIIDTGDFNMADTLTEDGRRQIRLVDKGCENDVMLALADYLTNAYGQ